FTHRVAILDALTQHAVLALVDVIPVAPGRFLHVAGLRAARSAGVEARGTAAEARCGNRGAGRVAQQARAVTDGRSAHAWRAPVSAPGSARGNVCRGRCCGAGKG